MLAYDQALRDHERLTDVTLDALDECKRDWKVGERREQRRREKAYDQAARESSAAATMVNTTLDALAAEISKWAHPAKR
jgi:hypothetical protein